MLKSLRADIQRFVTEGRLDERRPLSRAVKLATTPGFLAVATYRLGHYARKMETPGVGTALRAAYFVANRAVVLTTGITIHAEAEIGDGLYIENHGDIVLNGRLGRNVTVVHGAQVLTASDGKGRGHATVGDNVYLGAGSKIVGPVHVGDNAKIGVNAVVNMDVPEGAVVATMPARVVTRGDK